MIRQAVIDDIPRMVGMGAEFHANTRYAGVVPWDDASFAATLDNLMRAGRAWVYEKNGRVEGMAGALLHPMFFNARYLACQELFVWVNPSERGAGMQLFDMLESWAIDQGARIMIIAFVPGLREKALDRLYRARGYALTDSFYTKVL
jgi:GNAT superfamily N-acetyltransferase